MVAWTGIEHFQMGRFDPPPPANEPEDAVVCLSVTLNFGFFCHAFVGLILNSNVQVVLLSSSRVSSIRTISHFCSSW